MRLNLILVAVLAGWAGLAPAGGRWYTYRDCRLIEHDANDGDSFHVRTKSDHRIFRLYFVDASETDDSIPRRNREQERYFNIDAARNLRLAKEATTFTRAFLDGTFTVYSKREDARGRSRRDRFFAMVKAGDRWLSEALVARGLARVYGRGTDLPDGSPGRKHWARLRVLERRARRDGLGGWGAGKGEAIQAVEEHARRVPGTVAVYDPETGRRFIGMLRRGTTVTVVRAASPFMVHVRFPHGEQTRAGQCRRRDLGLRVDLPRRR